MNPSVRIVAGKFRGRRLAVPRGIDTRPTADRVREALFSSLISIGGEVSGLGAALDAFAGSGALGFEALSRGLPSVTFLERNRAALDVLRRNIGTLDVRDRAFVVPGDALALVESGALMRGPFSLLLLDPPYRLASSEIARFVSALMARDLLEDGALVAYEHSSQARVTWPAQVASRSRRQYGSTEVDIAQYEREAESQ